MSPVRPAARFLTSVCLACFVAAMAAAWINAHSRLSTSACRLASTMFSLTPMVPHSVTPSVDWISTRVVAAVPVVESMIRTL